MGNLTVCEHQETKACLVIDPGPEAAAHVTALAGILENEPPEMLLHAKGASEKCSVVRLVCRQVHVHVLVLILGRATNDRRCVCLFQLAAQLLDQVLEITQPFHDIFDALAAVDVTRRCRQRGCGRAAAMVGAEALEAASPSRRAISRWGDADNVGS